MYPAKQIPDEELQMHIEMIQHTYQELNLSYQQALKIYLFEEENSHRPIGYSFSFWEEKDAELDCFTGILNEAQLKLYLQHRDENIFRHEQFLIDSDLSQKEYLDYHTDLINFYREQYIPDFFKEDLFIMRRVVISENETKLRYLKSEYKKFLDRSRAKIIVNHYRHSKLFEPITLQLALTRCNLLYIVPQFNYFQSEMDEPTKAVANYLVSTYQRFHEQHKVFFEQKAKALQSFMEHASAKHITPKGGWSTNINLHEPEETIKAEQIMQVLLADEMFYGLKESDDFNS